MQSENRTLEFQNKGHTHIKCPLAACSYFHLFTETNYTVVDGPATRRRRDEFLRRQHAEGLHENS